MGGIVRDITDAIGITNGNINSDDARGDAGQFDKDGAAAKEAQQKNYQEFLSNIEATGSANQQALDSAYAKSSANFDAASGKSSSAADSAASVATGLGIGQINAAQDNFENAQAFNKPMLDAQSQAAQTEFSQGQKNLAAFDADGRPLQKMIRDDALGIITPEKQQLMDQAAGTAIADARSGTTQQQNMIMRQGARYGFSADKFASMGADAAAVNAQSAVAAANAGRTQAGDRFTANINSAYKNYADGQTSGANLINSGTNATSSAAATNNQTAAQYINGLAAGAGTIQTGQAQRISGLGGVLNSAASTYGTDASAKSTGSNAVLNAKTSAFGVNTNANTSITSAAMAAKAGVTNANTGASASMYNTQENNAAKMMQNLAGFGASFI